MAGEDQSAEQRNMQVEQQDGGRVQARAGLERQRGASAIEYVIIAAVVALALWAAVEALNLADLFGGIFDQIGDALGRADSGD